MGIKVGRGPRIRDYERTEVNGFGSSNLLVPNDNTQPQRSEMTFVVSETIEVKNVDTQIRIRFALFGSQAAGSGSERGWATAIFEASGNPGSPSASALTIERAQSSGDTSATLGRTVIFQPTALGDHTFELRLARAFAANVAVVNGYNGASVYGASSLSFIELEIITPVNVTQV